MTSYASTDDALRYWARADPTKPYIVRSGEQFTYAEVDEWVDRVATWLVANGVTPGDRVGLIGWNSVEWVIAGLATLRASGVYAAIGERSVAGEIVYLTDFTDTRKVFVADSHRAVVDEALAAGARFDILPLSHVLALRHGLKQPFIRPERAASEVAAIIYSSGSTGMPKGVAHSMESILAFCQEWSMMEPALSRSGRILAVLPLAPMGGFFNSYVRAGVVGSTAYLMPKFDEREALKLLTEEKCDSLMSPPIIFQRISALPEFASADLSTLTYAIIGGAPVPLDEFDKWFARGAALRQCYGQTESGGHFSVMPTALARENRAGCGAGSIYRQFRIARTDGNPCAPGESGEVLMRGPGMMIGYWENEEATAKTIQNGWIHTGDLGCIDENGILTITDRIKEIIITGGFNVGPTEVENVISEINDIDEVAVVAVPDKDYGEGIGAVVRLKSDCTVDDIIAHCRSRLAGYKVPRYILVVDEELPRTPGKGNHARAEIRKRFGAALAAAEVFRKSSSQAAAG